MNNSQLEVRYIGRELATVSIRQGQGIGGCCVGLCLAKTSYTYKMNDLAQTSIRTFPI